jgi:hypothetical protein
LNDDNPARAVTNAFNATREVIEGHDKALRALLDVVKKLDARVSVLERRANAGMNLVAGGITWVDVATGEPVK